MKRKEEKFLKKGLDTPLTKQPDGQISGPQARADAVRWHRNMKPYFPGCLYSRLVRQPRMRYAAGFWIWK
jgi:hypothetical protein